MNMLLVGNAVAFFGALLMTGTGFIKNPKKVVGYQCLQFLIMGVGNLILGGLAGFITNMVGIVRNVYCLKFNFNWPVKIFFMAIQIIITWYAGVNSLLGFLPIIAACVYTCLMDTDSETVMKWVLIITEVMWVVYDIVQTRNYVSAVFDILTICTNLYGLFMIRKALTDTDKEATASV